ncbi:MAG TPA: alkaline phosphatase family protein, partial [Thermoanaerobaculia bacterium]
MKRSFGAFLLLLWPSLGLAQPAKPARVVILGFDGVDSQVVEQMLAAGRLPNLEALKRRGGYSPLTPTVPAQTPVSWATFTTGLDPGGHEIFDFLKRNPADRVPTFAVAEETTAPILFGKSNPIVLGLAAGLLFWLVAVLLYVKRRRILPFLILDGIGVLAFLGAFFAVRAWLPDERPAVRNNRRGETFWSVAGARPASVLRMPVTFPPESFRDGKLLSGLGVPDLSGRIGKPAFYTSDPFFAPREGNDFSIELVRLESNVGTIATRL